MNGKRQLKVQTGNSGETMVVMNPDCCGEDTTFGVPMSYGCTLGLVWKMLVKLKAVFNFLPLSFYIYS